MFKIKNIKLIFGSIHMKPLALVSALIVLVISVWGFVYLFIRFIRHPSIGLGLFFVAFFFYSKFYKNTKKRF